MCRFEFDTEPGAAYNAVALDTGPIRITIFLVLYVIKILFNDRQLLRFHLTSVGEECSKSLELW